MCERYENRKTIRRQEERQSHRAGRQHFRIVGVKEEGIRRDGVVTGGEVGCRYSVDGSGIMLWLNKKSVV